MMTVAAFCAAATGTATKLKNTLQKDSCLILGDTDYLDKAGDPTPAQIKDLIMSGQQSLNGPKTRKFQETNTVLAQNTCMKCHMVS